MIKIEGIATISEKGFHFDSGMPSNEPVLNEEIRMHGTLKVAQNACVDFEDSNRVYLPPVINRICDGENYHVKRTSRHYIIQIKLPVLEKRQESEDRIEGIMPLVMGEITLDRKELMNQ